VIVTLVAAIALPLLLPPRFSLGPKWLVPTVEALLLLALAIADPGLIDRRSTVVRTISLVLVAVLAVGAIGVTVRLVTDLIEGGPETNSASALLGAGFLVWLYIIIASAFLHGNLTAAAPKRPDPTGFQFFQGRRLPQLRRSVHGEGQLGVHGRLGPQGAVIVEHRDTVGLRYEFAGLRIRDRGHEIHDGLPGRRVTPTRERLCDPGHRCPPLPLCG
jgi:hypothetical protein